MRMIVARFQRIFAVSQAPTWRHRLASRQGLASSGLCGLLGPSGLAGVKRPVRQGRSSPVVMTGTCDQVSSPFIMRRCQNCSSAPIVTVERSIIGTGRAACGCRMFTLCGRTLLGCLEPERGDCGHDGRPNQSAADADQIDAQGATSPSRDIG